MLVSTERLAVRPSNDGARHAIQVAIRGALQLAITERARIVATMWREPEDTGPARLVSGTPYEFSSRSDGRERVHLRVAEGAEQILLVERIMRVMPDGG